MVLSVKLQPASALSFDAIRGDSTSHILVALFLCNNLCPHKLLCGSKQPSSIYNVFLPFSRSLLYQQRAMASPQTTPEGKHIIPSEGAKWSKHLPYCRRDIALNCNRTTSYTDVSLSQCSGLNAPPLRNRRKTTSTLQSPSPIFPNRP